MLFEPVKIGGLELKNRMVMPAIHHSYTPDGFVNDRLVRYYETRARGGVGLVMVGGCSIDIVGSGPFMVGLHDDCFIEGLSRLTGAVKGAGAKIGAQLYQAGRYSFSRGPGQEAIAPSPLASRLTRQVPREMTREDIDTVIESFAAAALRAKQAGFDAVEIIASAGYLICQFLSPVTNQRTDDYGGSWENRCRFGIEVIGKVRERVGKDYTLFVRLSGHDFIPGSNTNWEAAAFAAKLEKAGADCFNVTGGWHETRIPQLTGDLPRGGFAYLARGVKEAVKVPVVASNRINDPQVAEQILKDGSADLVSVGRGLIADPDFPNKVKSGDFRSIRRCLACNQGCMDMVFTGQSIFCAVNPLAGREHEVRITPADKPRSVLVIGGGPAGLEAARVSALRGHKVTLWEKEDRLGGQLHYAAQPPGKQEFLNLVGYYTHELESAGVEVVLEKEASEEDIISSGYDAVVVATGARPAGAPFPVESDRVVSALDILSGKTVPGKKVVVVGGGSVGCETALAVAEMGTLSADSLKFLMQTEAESFENLKMFLNRGTRSVTLVEALKGVGRDLGRSTRWVAMQNLRRLHVKVMDNAAVKKVDGQGVLIERNGEETVLPSDTVVLATGACSVNDLAEKLDGKVPELHVIGDASSPRKVTEAIREGFDLALKL